MRERQISGTGGAGLESRTACVSGALHPGAVLTIVLVCYFMIVLDNSIVFTGLPRIREDLGFSAAGLSWVQNAYTLVFGGFLLLGARAAQGIGSAILAPSTLSLLTANFAEGPERTRAVAAYGSVAGLGASVIDVLGAVTSTLGMSSLVFGIVTSAEAGWGSPVTITTVATGVVLLAMFVLIQWRADQPIMPLQLFRSAQRSGAYAARMLFTGAMMGYFFYVTQFMQSVLGFSPLQAGAAFLPMTVVNFVVAIAQDSSAALTTGALLLALALIVSLLFAVRWRRRRTGATTAAPTEPATRSGSTANPSASPSPSSRPVPSEPTSRDAR